MSSDNLGDRMKGYEDVQRYHLTKRIPTLIRLDGKAFHTFTRGFRKPCDMVLQKTMWDTATYLCKNIQGCKIAYTQSDEITLLLIDYDTLDTSSWFEKNIVKMISVSASMATLAFNSSFISNVNAFKKEIEIMHSSEPSMQTSNFIDELIPRYESRFHTALFDSRVFNIPAAEVCNCFLWRQQDATRNAIKAVGQANFSHKELHKKNGNQIQEMLWQEKQINFNDYPIYQKRGVCIVKESYLKNDVERSRWVVDENTPIFSQDRNYIEQYVYID